MDAMWLYETNQSRVVILFHAYTGSPMDVRLLAQELHRKGYAVYVPVFRGHENGCVQEVLQATPQEWMEDARQAVRFVRQHGFTTVAAMGLSMGGIMATGLACEEMIEIAGTFCSPVSTRQAQLPGLMQTFLQFARDSVSTTEELENIRQQASQQMEAIQEMSATIAAQLEKVTGPFYIAQAGQDQLVDPEVSIEMKEDLINAQVDFHWFEEAPHVITVSKQRKEFQHSVIEFLEQQEWR